MSVYLGDNGSVEIRRQGEPVEVELLAQDVDVDNRRFGLDWSPGDIDTVPSPLITGDQVEFKTTNGSNLVLVSGESDEDVTRWVHIDSAGGIRLYSNYADAINGGIETAVELSQPSSNQTITVDVVNVNYSCLAQISDYEITTNRDTVNVTELGEEFKRFYDQGLISGQGSINCIWDYKFTACADRYTEDAEVANYFSQLVIRFKEGSRFKALLTIFRQGAQWVWYECDCICTSVGMSFNPTEVIRSQIAFITTGPIQLKQGQPPGYLLQEDGFEILLEQPPGAIELESSV